MESLFMSVPVSSEIPDETCLCQVLSQGRHHMYRLRYQHNVTELSYQDNNYTYYVNLCHPSPSCQYTVIKQEQVLNNTMVLPK